MDGPIMKMGFDPETDHIPGFVTVDITASYNVIRKENYTVKATLSAYNLFDKSWETFVHYPMIGRFLSAGFTLTL
ncbi:MAG: TonB-dependent receptor [Bacteroides sp.]|nr:TonB-dependent receptor [Bacteroides sp.]